MKAVVDLLKREIWRLKDDIETMLSKYDYDIDDEKNPYQYEQLQEWSYAKKVLTTILYQVEKIKCENCEHWIQRGNKRNGNCKEMLLTDVPNFPINDGDKLEIISKDQNIQFCFGADYSCPHFIEKNKILLTVRFIREKDGRVTVTCPEINLAMFGEDKRVALQSFYHVLEDFMENLFEKKDRLGEELSWHCEILERFSGFDVIGDYGETDRFDLGESFEYREAARKFEKSDNKNLRERIEEFLKPFQNYISKLIEDVGA